MTIDMTKVGISRGLHNLQKEFVSTSTKHVTFTTFSTEKGTLQKGLLQNGSRPNGRVNLPANGDVKAVLGHAPNVTNIVLRDTTSREPCSSIYLQGTRHSSVCQTHRPHH
jgi:hypothetical protein